MVRLKRYCMIVLCVCHYTTKHICLSHFSVWGLDRICRAGSLLHACILILACHLLPPSAAIHLMPGTCTLLPVLCNVSMASAPGTSIAVSSLFLASYSAPSGVVCAQSERSSSIMFPQSTLVRCTQSQQKRQDVIGDQRPQDQHCKQVAEGVVHDEGMFHGAARGIAESCHIR